MKKQSKNNSNQKSGFTLVELLVVLAIIGVLTGSVVMAIRGARRAAMVRRSESQYLKIQTILQDGIEDLLDQPLPLNLPTVAVGPHADMAAEGRFSRNDRFRIEARRKLILSRFPYHSSLLHRGGVQAIQSVSFRSSSALGRDPNLSLNFNLPNSFLTQATAFSDLTLPATASSPDSVAEHNVNSSEMLYWIISRTWVDDEPALQLFRDSEFGDTDGDGLLEVLDAFGEPIYFRIQMTLPLSLDPTDPTNNPVTMINVPLDSVNPWMNGVDVSSTDGTTSQWFLTNKNTETFDMDGVRVVVTSQQTEPFDWNSVVPFF